MNKIEQLKQLEKIDEPEKDVMEYPIMNQLPHPRFNATTCVVDDVCIYMVVFSKEENKI